ncbi:VOC family protein [Bacillus velezensis]|uniref:VOC family protein n=1 Tax=Bacillus velezensis TaxID=492670 RepID=UPI00279DB393|nr:VOC family protein [Bacillus velezensis]
MKPRITVITLGADNLEKSLHFYRDGLALPTEGTAGTDLNDLQTELKLALWDRKDTAHESNVTITDPAHETFCGGYAVHFQDPDGHLWEIVWNPHWDASE